MAHNRFSFAIDHFTLALLHFYDCPQQQMNTYSHSEILFDACLQQVPQGRLLAAPTPCFHQSVAVVFVAPSFITFSKFFCTPFF